MLRFLPLVNVTSETYLQNPKVSRKLSRHRRLHLTASEPQRKFSEFLEFKSPSDTPATNLGKQGASELVDRATSVLEAARKALDSVRQRDPAEARNRRTGPEIRTVPPSTPQRQQAQQQDGSSSSSSQWSPGQLQGDSSLDGSGAGRRGDALQEDDHQDADGGRSLRGSSSSGKGSGGAPGLVDSWFASKVDTGPMAVQRAAVQPIQDRTAASVALLDRRSQPETLEFGGVAAPAPASPQGGEGGGAPSIFPQSLQLRFESEVSRQREEEELAAAGAAAATLVAAPGTLDAATKVEWEERHGEERGPAGYWYRWTERRGQDAAGRVQWYERWWEATDWAGMRELGAEKWGANANGDAWRETWRESLNIEANGQPWVERSAHKWARNFEGCEWEEKWGEQYYSGGRIDKWADKWGREGGDIWHEKWGESYDGRGGCVKYTDKWAERSHGEGCGTEQWGDKWEERFKDGKGEKKGETWSVAVDGHRYNRWWGERHFGDGWVQKHGNSTTGEHWDTTEQSGTYYNCNPHFNYKMALYHSPVLRGLQVAPREGAELELELGGAGGGDGRAGLGNGFGALM